MKEQERLLRLSNDEVAMIEGDEDFSGSEIELLDISHMSGSSGGAKEPIETRQAVASSSNTWSFVSYPEWMYLMQCIIEALVIKYVYVHFTVTIFLLFVPLC